MNKQRQRAGRFLKRFYIGLAAAVLLSSNLLQLPVVKAATATPTWTVDSSGTTNGLSGITYGNGKWAAVGSGKTILTSSDGIQWSTIKNLNGVTNSQLQQIAYDGRTWWMTDGFADALYSSSLNPSSGWSDTYYGSTSTPTGLAVSASSSEKIVVVDGTTMYEYNGTSWSTPISSGPYAVIYADGKYVVGESGEIQYSTDGGSHWSSVSLIHSGSGDIIYSITYSRGQFVAVGSNQHVQYGVVYTSPDGITWTRQSVSLPILNSVAGSANGYIAVGNGGAVYSSPDGLTWTAEKSGVTQNLNQVYYAAGRYVAVGDNGTIITQSTNANLVGLSLNKGTPSPSFSSGTTSYTAGTEASSISVTASVYDKAASLTINGAAVPSGSSSTPIALTQASNTIPIVVTAQDGITQKTYTLTVKRLPPPIVTGLQHSHVTQTGWTESWSSVSGATGYNVYINGAKVNNTPTTSTSYSVTNETPGTAYTVKVTAVNVGGESGPSSADSVTTVTNAAGMPTHSSVTQTGWTESWGSVTGARSYDVYLNNKKIGSVTQTVYDFKGMQPGTTYKVQVSSVNASGQPSTLSAPDSVTTGVYGPTPPTIITAFFPESAEARQAYSAQIREIGGMSPLKWSITSGTLPPGLTLNNQGIISGTPTSGGNYTFTVKVTDNNNLSSSKRLTLVVNGLSASVSVTSGTEQAGTLGRSYQQTLQATGGTAPYTWSTLGGLPAGLSLNSNTGVISGTPAKTGIYQLKVQVTGADGATSEKAITLDLLKPYEREVLWNAAIKNVPAVVRQEGTTSTTYMPIWYVMQLLKPMGIQSTWDGKIWQMTTRAQPNLSSLQVGQGVTTIYLNGTAVQKVDTVAATDPSTNKPTTYMPIWYVMQLLNRVGLHSIWNGTTWTATK